MSDHRIAELEHQISGLAAELATLKRANGVNDRRAILAEADQRAKRWTEASSDATGRVLNELRKELEGEIRDRVWRVAGNQAPIAAALIDVCEGLLRGTIHTFCYSAGE